MRSGSLSLVTLEDHHHHDDLLGLDEIWERPYSQSRSHFDTLEQGERDKEAQGSSRSQAADKSLQRLPALLPPAASLILTFCFDFLLPPR